MKRCEGYCGTISPGFALFTFLSNTASLDRDESTLREASPQSLKLQQMRNLPGESLTTYESALRSALTWAWWYAPRTSIG